MADELVDDDEVRRAFGAKATTPPEEKPAQPGRAPRPQRGAAPKGKRRVVIDAQAGRKPTMRRERGAPRAEPKREPEAPTGPVKVPSGITVKDLAEKLGISPAKIITLMMGLGEMVTLTVSLTDEAVELIGEQLDREIILQHTTDEEEEEVVFEDDPDDSSHGRRWSRSWATSTTARRRCWTPSASRRWSPPRPAASPSTSAPTRWTSATGARSPSSTPRATRRSPPCAPAAPRPPTSPSWWSQPTTASCRRRSRRSTTPRPPACRSSSR